MAAVRRAAEFSTPPVDADKFKSKLATVRKMRGDLDDMLAGFENLLKSADNWLAMLDNLGKQMDLQPQIRAQLVGEKMQQLLDESNAALRRDAAALLGDLREMEASEFYRLVP